MDGWIDRLMDGWMNVWIPGGTLIFPCIRRIGSFFLGGGVRILNFDIFGGFQKNNFFFFFFLGGGGIKILWIFFFGGGGGWGGHHKIGLYLGVISMHFRVFS